MKFNMKKLWSILAGLCMMISLSACSSSKNIDEDALKTFANALTALVEQDSISFTAEIKGDNIGDAGELGSFQGEVISKNNDLQLSLIPVNENIANLLQFYIKDGTLYTNSIGVKSKQPLGYTGSDISTIKDNASYLRSSIGFIKPFLDTVSRDGNQIHITLDSDSLNKFSNEQYNSALSYEKISLSGIVEDDILKSLELTFQENGMAEGKNTVTTLTLDIKINAVNQTDTIHFPDLSDYQTSTSSAS